MDKLVIKNKENINQTLFVDFFKSSKNDILPEIDLKSDNIPKKNLGTIYQFTPPTTYCIYENIKKDDFRFGSRLFIFNSCSLLKSYAFYIIVGNFQGQFFHLKTTV